VPVTKRRTGATAPASPRHPGSRGRFSGFSASAAPRRRLSGRAPLGPAGRCGRTRETWLPSPAWQASRALPGACPELHLAQRESGLEGQADVLLRLHLHQVCSQGPDGPRRVPTRRGDPHQDRPGLQGELVQINRLEEGRGLASLAFGTGEVVRTNAAACLFERATRFANSDELGVVRPALLRQARKAGNGAVSIAIDGAHACDLFHRVRQPFRVGRAGLLTVVLLVEHAGFEQLQPLAEASHSRNFSCSTELLLSRVEVGRIERLPGPDQVGEHAHERRRLLENFQLAASFLELLARRGQLSIVPQVKGSDQEVVSQPGPVPQASPISGCVVQCSQRLAPRTRIGKPLCLSPLRIGEVVELSYLGVEPLRLREAIERLLPARRVTRRNPRRLEHASPCELPSSAELSGPRGDMVEQLCGPLRRAHFVGCPGLAKLEDKGWHGAQLLQPLDQLRPCPEGQPGSQVEPHLEVIGCSLEESAELVSIWGDVEIHGGGLPCGERTRCLPDALPDFLCPLRVALVFPGARELALRLNKARIRRNRGLEAAPRFLEVPALPEDHTFGVYLRRIEVVRAGRRKRRLLLGRQAHSQETPDALGGTGQRLDQACSVRAQVLLEASQLLP
jgi:hypothetical protein